MKLLLTGATSVRLMRVKLVQVLKSIVPSHSWSQFPALVNAKLTLLTLAWCTAGQRARPHSDAAATSVRVTRVRRRPRT